MTKTVTDKEEKMRIISGTNKGKKLYAPEGARVRPTGDKIKEAIFNIIGPIDEESIILELFAGSGSMGIEFLARGAKHCTFIDVSRKSLNYVKKNLELCSFIGKAKIILSDYEKAIISLSKNDEKFDYIFADPPYDKKLCNKTLNTIIQYDILKYGGLLIIESDKSEKVIDNNATNVIEYKEKIYGRTKISIIKHLEE
ncbi:MAG: 16S rRNA (guanine(966)-N(2))-methyltransferase RsmD [Tissierellia bacterium]|jgi:16S rRNA (guanine(966)-N(2))-methyltransferase RsmD|nr:16S rRNA (guanine(966)-N(2))-methyltransferase RsmD [Tissierellia bacterium]MDD3752040.1 16S rRNA (guanine(966)-N(2))-methyltransferase RsmD [Tissierellia bacterium]MDD4045624.1 16S rRNA (guanine(966)-N(2))-methyltransferase RsmD [Tissierellia bacterium]MDD4678908.1 16S rRNA (guanine(966)-N(2))-methyltransferase RsmD [Tissierellia bacterium]